MADKERLYSVKWLTTSDNPYDPFKEFDRWYFWDETHGYCTCGYIMRIADVDLNDPPNIQLIDVNAAVDEIMKFNLTGNYRVVETTATADEL